MDVLAQALANTDDDLEANRAGRLSAAQKVRLLAELKQHGYYWVVPLLAVVGGFLLHVLYLILFGQEGWDWSVFGAGTTVSYLLAQVLYQFVLRQFKGEILKGTLQITSGHVRAQLVASEWKLFVEDKEFSLPTARLATLIRDGARYTVYHLGERKKLVAIEALDVDGQPISEKPKRTTLTLGDDGELVELDRDDLALDDKPKNRLVE
jgi:hypothetical protein